MERYGLCGCKPVLTNIANELDTLVNYVKLQGQKVTLTNYIGDKRRREDNELELEELVAKPDYEEFNVNPLNVKQCDAMKAGFYVSLSLKDGDLANVGFKATSERYWTLSIGKGRITKKFVSCH